MDELLLSYCGQALDIIGAGFTDSELGPVTFSYANVSGKNLATNYEWAEVTSFYLHLNNALEFSPESDDLEGKAKLVLNEMRPVLINESDSIHYLKIMNIIKKMIKGKHETETFVNVMDSNNKIVNDEYIKTLRLVDKHIKNIISKSDLDYVYNRLLQHSDLRYQERFLQDYSNGLVPYIYIKNAIIVSYFADLLWVFLQPLMLFYKSIK